MQEGLESGTKQVVVHSEYSWSMIAIEEKGSTLRKDMFKLSPMPSGHRTAFSSFFVFVFPFISFPPLCVQ